MSHRPQCSGLNINIQTFLAQVGVSPLTGIYTLPLGFRRSFTSRGWRVPPSVSQFLFPFLDELFLALRQCTCCGSHRLSLIRSKGLRIPERLFCIKSNDSRLRVRRRSTVVQTAPSGSFGKEFISLGVFPTILSTFSLIGTIRISGCNGTAGNLSITGSVWPIEAKGAFFKGEGLLDATTSLYNGAGDSGSLGFTVIWGGGSRAGEGERRRGIGSFKTRLRGWLAEPTSARVRKLYVLDIWLINAMLTRYLSECFLRIKSSSVTGWDGWSNRRVPR